LPLLEHILLGLRPFASQRRDEAVRSWVKKTGRFGVTGGKGIMDDELRLHGKTVSGTLWRVFSFDLVNTVFVRGGRGGLVGLEE
jgi:hypothetical protein